MTHAGKYPHRRSSLKILQETAWAGEKVKGLHLRTTPMWGAEDVTWVK